MNVILMKRKNIKNAELKYKIQCKSDLVNNISKNSRNEKNKNIKHI